MNGKPSIISEDVGLCLALRRIRDGRVFAQGRQLWTDNDRPFPRVLAPFVRQLFEHGHAKVDHPADEGLKQQVRITQLGEGFLLELEATTQISPGQASTVDELS